MVASQISLCCIKALIPGAAAVLTSFGLSSLHSSCIYRKKTDVVQGTLDSMYVCVDKFILSHLALNFSLQSGPIHLD